MTAPPLPFGPDAWLAALGLRGDADADRVARRPQLRAAARGAPMLLAAQIAAILGVLACLPSPFAQPVWPGWAAATALAAAIVCARRRRDLRSDDVAAIRGAGIDGIALGALWAGATWLAVATGGGAQTIVLWMLICALALAIATVRLMALSLGFVVAAVAGAAVPLWVATGPVAAIPALSTPLLAAAIAVARAQALLAAERAAQRLMESEATVRLALHEFDPDHADWLLETDAARRIVRVGARFAEACARDPAEIEGVPLLQLLAGPSWDSGAFHPGLRQLADRLKNRDSFHGVIVPVLAGDQQRWWTIAATPRHDAGGHFAGFRGVASDITEQHVSTEKIHRMARFDTLTGLPNRLFVNESLGHALVDAERRGIRCAFMMIDLDRFKAVNDTLGHPVGDRLLERVSRRLTGLMSENEFIGRLGGDEFAVVVRDASDPQRVEQLAHAIIDTLSRPYEVDQHTLFIGASVGVATHPRDGRAAETLIRSADLALYRSKDRGGGVFHAYEPQLHAEAEERRLLELALRKALERDEFHLNYQPVVDARTGDLRGFEALLRWQHPELGLIPPNRFIGIAEETRLIGAIGAWVVRTACMEAARWPAPMRIAVNVSPEQLHQPQFLNIVADALGDSGLEPSRLELEVTESVFLREGLGATKVLEKIQALGVGLSLDDFGTGYSSLGYLGRTRFTSIKIDRSFVRNAASGTPEAVAIIRAVVAMADSLGMATTAEGVETARELQMVQQLGCTCIQGFYFGRPLAVADARALALRNGQAATSAVA